MVLANLSDVIRQGLVTLAAAVAVAVALLGASGASALTLQRLGPFFDQPNYVTSLPGDADRLLVVEREGTIELLRNGATSAFADLGPAIACPASGCKGERGLMSIALDPGFAANGRLYAAYASELDGAIHVDELVAAPDRETAAVVGTVLSIPHPDSSSHNGGQLQFGPDGELYLSTGDGGGANGQFHHSQKPGDPLGKILQVDVDSPGSYAIWSSGLRNPYRFSFDALTGDMAIGDVGQNLREEIDFAPSPFPGVTGGRGANYGWNCREGLLPGAATDVECGTPPPGGFAEPVFDYGHTPDPDLGGAPRCSISGGYVVRDRGLGALYGHYVYADYCAGVLRSLQLPAQAGGRAGGECSLGLRLKNVVSFGEDANRRLYVVEQGGGVYRLAGLPPAGCPPPVAPTPQVESAQVRPPGSPTFIGIKPQRRRVERGKAALLTVWVSPCPGRKGEPLTLLRNGHANGTRYLSRACTAHFLRRIHRGTTFAAFTHEERGYMAGKSRKLTIRIAPRRRR
jgi:hypothetical protein